MDEKTIARFWSKVDRRGPDDCWEWQAGRLAFGHGAFWLLRSGRSECAHRVAWEIAHGTPPGDAFVCHRCDNPPCVNPSHLFLGTQRDNMRDKVSKSRQARGVTDGNSKYTEAIILDVRARVAAGMSQREAGAPYGITQAVASDIIRRKTWKHI